MYLGGDLVQLKCKSLSLTFRCLLKITILKVRLKHLQQQKSQ